MPIEFLDEEPVGEPARESIQLKSGTLEFLDDEPPVQGVEQPIQQQQVPGADAQAIPQGPPERGLLGNIKESFTGSDRQVPETEALPDVDMLPELGQPTIPGIKSLAGFLLTFEPEEAAQIIQANFPDIKRKEDEKGNIILTSGKNGKDFSFKPGLRGTDLPKVGIQGAAFALTGGASSVIKKALASALTQFGIEATQKAVGGDLDKFNVLLAGASEFVPPAASAALKKSVGLGKQAVGKGIKPAIAGAVEGISETVPPVRPDLKDIGETARAAATAGTERGKQKAVSKLAGQVAPDKETLEAATRLGIQDHLQPDHLTTSQAFREVSQAIKSVPGSKAKQIEETGVLQVFKRADDLITEFGGTEDLSTLGANMRAKFTKTLDDMGTKEKGLYDQLEANIKPVTKVKVDNIMAELNNRIKEQGKLSNLTTTERDIHRRLAPTIVRTPGAKKMTTDPFGRRTISTGEEKITKILPNYALLNQVRKDINAASFAKEGPFRNEVSGRLTKLRGILLDDQKLAAEAGGQGELFAAAREVGKGRFAVQNDMMSVFGKELDVSIVTPLTTSVKRLAQGDVEKFSKLINSIPEDLRQETVASGLATVFGKNKEPSLKNFATWHQNLMKNKQASAALLSNLPEGAPKRLKDFAKVSEAISKARDQKIQNGRLVEARNIMEGTETLLSGLYSFGARTTGVAVKGAVAGSALGAGAVPGAAVAFALSLKSLIKPKTNILKLADELIASPEFLTAAKQIGSETEDKAIKRLSRTKIFRRIRDKVSRTEDIPKAEQWLRQLIHAGRQAPSKEEQ